MITSHFALHGLAGTGLLVSALLAIFLPLRPLLRRIVGSQWLALLWLAILARLLVPMSLESRWSLLSRWPVHPVASSATISEPWKIKSIVVDASHAEKSNVSVPSTPASAAAPHARMPGNVLNIIWFAGFALNLGVLVLRWRQTRRLAAKTSPATDDRLLKIFASIPAPLRRNVQLRMTDMLQVPTVAGVVHPQIWMPQSWLLQFTDNELHDVLLHELGHVRRCDLLVQWLFAVAQCLHWFNPLVWFAARAARLDREMACDAWVMARSDTSHSDYGATLMKTVRLLRSPLRMSPASVAMASGRQSLCARFSSIGAFRPVPAWRGLAGIAVMSAALATATTSPVTAQDASPSPAGSPVVAPASSPVATPDVTKGAENRPGTHVEIQTRFIEITEEAWKKTSPELILETGLRSGDIYSTGPETLASQFPELKKEKKTYADLVREMTLPKNSQKNPDPLPGWKIIEVLGREKREALIKMLLSTEGCRLLSAPAVTIKSGQEGVIAITRQFRYASAYGPDALPTEFDSKDIGFTLRVKPEIGPDGQTIDLNLADESVTLLGFIGENGATFAPPTQTKIQRFASPAFSTHTIKTNVSVWDNQTLLFGGVQLEVEAGKNGSDPHTVRKIMLTAVTARIVDAGKSVRAPSAKVSLQAPVSNSAIPRGIPIEGKIGFVKSPYAPDAGPVDLRGFPKDTEVKDPYTGKIFVVP